MSKEAVLAQLDASRAQDNVKCFDISGLDLTQCDISEVLYYDNSKNTITK